MVKILQLIAIIAFLSVNLYGQAWVQTNGPYGGDVREIYSTRLGTLYCATDGGVYRSTNNGASWSEVQFSSPYYNTIDYVYANDEGFIFIGTDIDNFVSGDSGTTWTTSFDFYGFYSVVSDSYGTLYASTENQGVQVSFDNGNTWNSLMSGTLSGGRLYYSKLHRLYHTTTGGLFEIQLADSLSMTQLTAIQFQDFSEGAPGEFIGGSQNETVSFSSDTGKTWSTWTTTELFESGDYYRASGFDSSGKIYVATYYRIHTSGDKGSTWNTTFWSYERIPLTFHRSTQGDLFLGTLSGGIYRFESSSDTWLEINNGINSGRPWSIAANSDGTVVVVQAERIWRSNDRGETWEKLPGIFRSLRSVWFDSQGTLYAAQIDSLYVSVDEGSSWSRRPYPAGTTGLNVIRNSKDELLFLAGENKFVKTKSDGTFISYAQLPMPVNYLTDFSLAKNGDMFLITGQGYATGEPSRLLRSTDNGNTWSEILVQDYLSSIAVNIFGQVFVAQQNSGFYYKSVDNGDTWVTLQFPNVFNSFNWVHRIRTDGTNTLIADNGLTVVISTDRGDTWVEWDTGKKESVTWQMEYSPDGYMYLGTQGQGLYRTRLPIITIPQTEQYIGVYPNPFNETTRFEFDLAEPSFVELHIYDILGRLVELVYSGQMPAGVQVQRWQPRTVATGIYIARLKINETVSTAKVILLR